MTTENFFERISNGKSSTARIASNSWLAFACLCSPGVFFKISESQTSFGTEDIESWFGALLLSGFNLYAAYDIRNFGYGKKVYLESVYYDATKKNTPVRWLSLVLDLMLSGFFCYMAISQYDQLYLKLL
jgi:hypothetical protein